MKEPMVFLEHINEAIEDIESFIKKLNKNSFLKNKEKQNAVIRSLEVIGEAVKNLPIEFSVKYPSVEWSHIAGMRNKLVHHYFGVDLNSVWKVVKDDLPKLKKDIEFIIKQEEEKNEV
jgi:hypothetical protein